MKIDRLVLGMYETNCYVLRDNEVSNQCLIIDAGLQAKPLIDFLREQELDPIAVVLTHGHIDHIAGVQMLRANFPKIRVHIHKLDAEMLTGAPSNLSLMHGVPFSTDPADVLVEEGSTIEQAGMKLKVLHTPGHTPGGICLYARDDGIVFTDDALFADSIGRTDFPGGDTAELLQSIKARILALPGQTKVYPGHGPATTVAQEKTHNPFFP
jgi:hydroxyacylglutathione hydrolase